MHPIEIAMSKISAEDLKLYYLVEQFFWSVLSLINNTNGRIPSHKPLLTNMRYNWYSDNISKAKIAQYIKLVNEVRIKRLTIIKDEQISII